MKVAFHQTFRFFTSAIAEATSCAATAGPGPNISNRAKTNVVEVVISWRSLRNVTRDREQLTENHEREEERAECGVRDEGGPVGDAEQDRGRDEARDRHDRDVGGDAQSKPTHDERGDGGALTDRSGRPRPWDYTDRISAT